MYRCCRSAFVDGCDHRSRWIGLDTIATATGKKKKLLGESREAAARGRAICEVSRPYGTDAFATLRSTTIRSPIIRAVPGRASAQGGGGPKSRAVLRAHQRRKARR
jgi:hypothetical protein